MLKRRLYKQQIVMAVKLVDLPWQMVMRMATAGIRLR